jgi:hypothetical protein
LLIPGALAAVIFSVLCVATFVWMFVVSLLCSQLELRHIDKYRAMGEPTLFRNMTYPLLTFLFKREDRSLQDSRISRLTATMLVFFSCYSILFLSFSLIIALGAVARHAP